MMKVCFLNQTMDDATGAGHFIRSLLDALKNLSPGFEYVVLTARGSGAFGEVPVIFPERKKLLLALPRIRRILSGYDIVHALDGYPFGVVAALALLGTGEPLVITAIGSGALAPLWRPIAGSLLRSAYRRADRLSAVSHYTRVELLKAMPELDIQVINHGVDIREFSDPNEIGGTEKWEIKKLEPYVLSVGALKPRKGYRYSLAAFARLADSFPNLRYVIVGDGDRHEFDIEISKLRLGRRVVFFKNVARPFLRALYRRAELFLLLPVDDDRDVEGFGLVFLEAAAAGIPVIGTLESGAADAVAHGKNGFLVPPRDAARAASAMRQILSDRELRSRLARGSLEWAAEMSWERAARAYLAIYQELLRRAY